MNPPAPALPQAPFKLSTIMLPLTAIIVGTFMAILDSTVVNVALPTLVRTFKTDLHVIQWVVTGYILAQAAVIPLSGWLSDRFGAKRLYMISIALFTLGSALCATAASGPMLIAFRVLQGLGGGMLMPIGMSFTFRLAPPERRGAVMGAFGVPMLLAPALGPIISGWLVQYADWRWIFLINVPVGIAAIVLALRSLPNLTAQRVPGALDVPGALLAPLAFAALSYGISESTSAGWTGAPTLAGIIGGTVALALFTARELTTEHPLLELRVFASRDYLLASITQWTGQVALFGAMFLVPLFLQGVRGYGAFDSGIYMLPMALAAGICMPIGGRLFDRIGARPLVVVGLVLVTFSSWMLAQVSSTTTGEALRLPLILRGMGMGLMMMALNTHLLNSAPRALVSRVTSLSSALQNVAGSLGIATLATVLQTQTAAHVATARGAVAAYQKAALARALAGAHSSGKGAPTLPHDVAAALGHYAAATLHTALAAAFDDTFLVATWVAAAGILLGLTLRRRALAAVVAPASAAPAASAETAAEGALGLAL